MKEKSTTIADRLKSIRFESGMTSSRMAEVLNVSRMSISLYENGERYPSYPFLVALAEQFGTDLHWLITGEEREKTNQQPTNPLIKRLLIAINQQSPKQVEKLIEYLEILNKA